MNDNRTIFFVHSSDNFFKKNPKKTNAHKNKLKFYEALLHRILYVFSKEKMRTAPWALLPNFILFSSCMISFH